MTSKVMEGFRWMKALINMTIKERIGFYMMKGLGSLQLLSRSRKKVAIFSLQL